MQTKNIFKTLAFSLLMPAVLLTTACSSDDDAIINNENINNTENIVKKGYELPVTINVSRQGDDDTRATYNDGTKTLGFSEGDKLFVDGTDYSTNGAGRFAGALTWQSGGTFSGTIITQNPYEGTADDLLKAAYQTVSATLLPDGYEDYGYWTIKREGAYNAYADKNYTKAFALTKATAVEQFSWEYGEYKTSYSAIWLAPLNAILSFTISGLTPNTEVTAVLKQSGSPIISGNVTTDGAGNATFAMAVEENTYFQTLSLTIGGHDITLTSGSKQLAAGKIYTVNRSAVALPEGALAGKFTINASGDKVRFSQGNLQAVIAAGGPTNTYNYEASSWQFAEHQWDFIGNAAGNTSFAEGSTVDLFGWVGNTATYNTYGLCTFVTTTDYSVINASHAYYGSGSGQSGQTLRNDWGTLAISNGGNTANSGWRTLTIDEWEYLFKTRSGATVKGTSNVRYTLATINTNNGSGGVQGAILFPDGVTIANGEATSWGALNDVSQWGTRCTTTQWTALAAKGCVFLPITGYRHDGTTVENATYEGYYWSSTPNYNDVENALSLKFSNQILLLSSSGYYRCYGQAVRLVRPVE